MNGPIPLPAAPAPALARSNRGTRLPGKRPSPADGLTPLPIAWPKREGVPRFGPRSRPAVRRGRIWTDQITESVAKPAGSGRSGAENTRESGHGSSSAAFTLPPPLGRSCAPPSHLWPRPPPNSLSLPASVATQRLVLILIVALRRRPLPLLCEAPEDQVPWPHPRSSNGATPTDIYTLFAPTSLEPLDDPRQVRSIDRESIGTVFGRTWSAHRKAVQEHGLDSGFQLALHVGGRGELLGRFRQVTQSGAVRTEGDLGCPCATRPSCGLDVEVVVPFIRLAEHGPLSALPAANQYRRGSCWRIGEERSLGPWFLLR